MIGQKAFNAISTSAARQGRRLESALASWFTPEGTLTRPGKFALEAAGINPADLNPQQIKAINAMAPRFKGYTPEQQGNAALLTTQGVRPTLGSTTQDPAIQMQESLLSKGGFTNRGAVEMRMSDDAAQAAIRGRVDQVAPPNAGIGPAQVKLVGMKKDIKSEFDQVFQNLRTEAQGTFIDQKASDALRAGLRESAIKVSSIADADNIMFDFPETLDGEVNLNEVFEWARKAGKRGPAGQEAKKAMFSALEHAAERDMLKTPNLLLEGSGGTGLTDNVVKRWMANDEQYKNFKGVWSANDLFSKLIQTDNQGVHLKYSPEEATNFLLNSSDSGWITKGGLETAVGKLRQTLGADSPEFNAIKYTIGRRIMGENKKPGATMRSAYQNAQMKRKALMSNLFTEEEMRNMDYITRAADLIQRKPGRGADINSTTALGLKGLTNDTGNLLKSIFPTQERQYLGPLISMATHGASKLFDNIKPRSSKAGKLLNPALGGLGGPKPPMAGFMTALGLPDWYVPESDPNENFQLPEWLQQ
jgi:hypothetical protein